MDEGKTRNITTNHTTRERDTARDMLMYVIEHDKSRKNISWCDTAGHDVHLFHLKSRPKFPSAFRDGGQER